VTTVDNQSWISIHAYVLVDWERIPLLLSLERLTEGSTSDQITRTIMNVVERDGGLSAIEVRQRLLCFRSDGAAGEEKWHCCSNLGFACTTLPRYALFNRKVAEEVAFVF
jgi:hypothetical protein